MITVRFTNRFNKEYKKADEQIKNQFGKRLEKFTTNPNHPELRTHPLHSEWYGYKSIDVTADWRAIFREDSGVKGEIIVYFEALGTHKELYG